MITLLLLSIPTTITTISAFRWPLIGCRYRYPVSWFEVCEATLIEPDLVLYAMDKVKLIRDRIKTA